MAVVGALMVGRFRTPSFKKATIYAENVSFVLLGFVGLAAALLTYPWVTLALADCAYLVAICYSLLKTSGKTPPKPMSEA
jgi:CDP-diacylglycerol---serine O-phosphatidyltransferase